MNSKVTLKDVAKAAGVSYQTVSKVLRGQMKVTAETQARIDTAVKQLGYRPNMAARNLRTQSSHLIGYGWQQVGDSSSSPILDQFLYSAIKQAEGHDYHLLAFLLEEDLQQATSLYRDLFARNQVDGFILADTNTDDPRIEFLIREEIPFAAFGRANETWDFCWVDVDGCSGMKQMTAHLQARGHQKIALITWPLGSQAGEERENGYLAQMAALGLSVEDDWMVRGDNNVDSGYRLMSELLSLPMAQRPTAVACVSDLLAIGAMNAIMTQGLRVGQDVAVTGYDNVPMSEFLFPPLTTVQQPVQQAGKRVVELLLQQIDKKPIAEKGILLEPELIVRQSS